MGGQRKVNTFVVCGLMIIVGVMSIGFAALSQKLDINGTAKVMSAESSWNVYFSDVNTDGLVGTSKWATAPTISTDTNNSGSNNKISFSCELVAPGDSCTVTATIKNGGTTKALYNDYTFTVDSSNQTGTEVKLDSGAIITVTPPDGWTAGNKVLNKDDTGVFTIKMELPKTLENLPENDTTHSVALSINFSQNQ